jgi:hypothetical protein
VLVIALAKYYRLYRISQTDNASYAGTKALQRLFYLGKLIVQQSFQPPAYFVIFSDEFKFTYKTVCSQTKHAVAPFPMMLFNLLLCVVQILRLCLPRNDGADVQRDFSSGSTG